MRFLFTSLLIATSISTAYATTHPSIIEMQTNVGTITMKLDWVNTPKSSENFLNYANKGFYKNTIFHNSVKNGNGYIQGGLIDAQTSKPKITLDKKPLIPIINESSRELKNTAGTVAMTHSLDTSADSTISQFFFNVTDNAVFDKSSTNSGNAVFAKIIGGMNVLNNIIEYKTTPLFQNLNTPTFLHS